jgi:hypothetical protein
MIDRMTGGAVGGGIAAVLAQLQRHTDILERIATQTNPAPASRPAAIPQRFTLSSLNPTNTWLTPGAVRIVGLCVGGDQAGRGVFVIGNDATIGFPIWCTAGGSQMFWFSERQEIDLPEGVEVKWSAPGGVSWDATIFYFIQEPQGRKAK